MKKIISALLIAIVLSILGGTFIPAGASGTTVATGLDTYGLYYPNLTNSFWANGYEYIWYMKGSTLYYKSGNGTVYGSEQTVRAVTQGQWSVGSNGSKVAYIYSSGSGAYAPVYWRMGTAEGNGSITWLAAEQNLGNIGTAGHCYVGWDSLGLPWIFITPSSAYKAYKNDHLDGTWSTSAGFPVTVKSYQYNIAYGEIGMFAMPDGGMAFLYSDSWNQRIHAKYWDGDSLSSEVSTSSLVASSDELANACVVGVVVNDKVGVVFETVSQQLRYVEYFPSSNSWGSEIVLQTGCDVGHQGAAIGVDYSTAKLYVWWENIPVANHMYQKQRALSGGSWSGVVDVFTSSGFGGWHGVSISSKPVGYGTVAVYYTEPAGTLKVYPVEYGSGKPIATANAATGITSVGADISAYVNWDGGSSECTLDFQWGGGGQEGNHTVSGFVHTGDTKTYTLTGLVPDNVYSYWVVVENENGTHYSNLQQFLTLPGDEPTVPIVTTMTVSHIQDTGAQVNGHLNYDGATGNGAWVGFQLRIHGTSEWVDSFWNCSSNAWGDCVNYHVFYTNEDFSGTLTGLHAHTIYDVRAQAKNGMNAPGTASYGDILTFTTGVIPGATITPSPYPLIPPNLIPGLNLNLSPNVKIFLALLVIVATMVGVGLILYKVPLVAGICAIADGVVWLVAFSIWGWLPGWVLLALIVILGMLILLIVLAKR